MSKSKDKERPPFWKPIARAKYDTAMMSVKEIQARILPKEMASDFDFEVPSTWKDQPALYLLRGLGLGKKGLPPGSGYGLVQSPYADIYTV